MNSSESLKVGLSVSVERSVQASDLEAFAQMSLDRNPMHFDEEFAATTLFERPVAHGMIGASLLSGALTKIMGEGNIWLDMNLQFKKPAFVGDHLKATLTVTNLDRRGVATLSARVENQKDELIVSGELRSMNFARRRTESKTK